MGEWRERGEAASFAGRGSRRAQRTVASEAFGKAERPARFLRRLVETTLRGESQYLKESLLGAEVFGRPASWDPRYRSLLERMGLADVNPR